jgi:hypothetical protein
MHSDAKSYRALWIVCYACLRVLPVRIIDDVLSMYVPAKLDADGDDLLATASGDQTIRVWDLSRAVGFFPYCALPVHLPESRWRHMHPFGQRKTHSELCH